MSAPDLFDKFLQQSLTPEEAEQLKELLKNEPGAGRQFVEYVNETSLLVRVGSQVESARAVSKAPLVEEKAVEGTRLPVPWWRWAALAACVAILLSAGGYLAHVATQFRLAVASRQGHVTVRRGHSEFPAQAGFKLKSGDAIKTGADGRAVLKYVDEATEVELEADSLLQVLQIKPGKQLELVRGKIEAKVAPQPRQLAMMMVTPHAEAKVLGTEFLLSADVNSTRLEVMEGAVQFANREDEKAIVVNGGFYATVGRKADLVAGSLLPAPWNSQDIGAVGLPGHARLDGQQCRIKGAGKNNCRTKDQLHFVYQVLEGNGEIWARVVDLEGTHKMAKAGVVIRENLKSAAPHAFLFLRAGSGLVFEHRPQQEIKADLVDSVSAPYWVRLARKGDTITAYKSADGVNWTQTGSDRFKMGKRIYVGLGVSSWNNSKLATSVFDNVKVIPDPAG